MENSEVPQGLGILSLFNVALIAAVALLPMSLQSFRLIKRLDKCVPLESLKRPIICIISTPVVLQTSNLLELFVSPE